MKIVIVSPFYPYRGGIAQFADHFSDALSQENEVLRINFKRQYPKILFPGKSQKVDNIDRSLEKSVEVLDSIGWFSFSKTSKKIIAFEPDLVVFAYWMPFMLPAYLGVFRKLKKKRMKCVALVHNFISHQQKPFERVLIHYFLSKMDRVFALSQTVSDQINEVLEKKSIAIKHPNYNQFGEKVSKEEAIEKLGLTTKRKIVLFFGLVREYKGFLDLIKAINLAQSDYFLLIAGECYGDSKIYENELNTLHGKDYRWDNRFISDDCVKYYFSVADVCVLPYKSASQSGVTAVSHHFQLPVIASNVGGIHEFVMNEKNGLLCPANDPEALAAAIDRYFSENLKLVFEKQLESNEGQQWPDFTKDFLEFVKK